MSKKTESKLKAPKEEPKTVANDEEEEDARIYRYNEIDFDNVDVGDLQEKNKDGVKIDQPFALIKYNDPQTQIPTRMFVQNGDIKITSGGVPGYHERYYPTDDKRENLSLPLDPEQKEPTRKLREFATAVDKFFSTKEVKDKVVMPLCKKSNGTLNEEKFKKYKYSPWIKIAKKKDDSSEDDEPKKRKIVVHDSVRMKFHMLKDGDVRKNLMTIKRVVGKEKIPVAAPTTADVFPLITLGTTVRSVISIAKIWVNRNPLAGADHILYGVTIKVMAINYTPSVRGAKMPSKFTMRESSSDDDDTKLDKSSSDKKSTKSASDKKKKSDSASEDEPVKPSQKKNTKKGSDSEDEPVKPSKKNTKQNSDSEDEPIKPSKKNTKKGSDSDDEPVKPNKKNTKKGSDSEDEPVKPNKKNIKKGSDDSDDDVKVTLKKNTKKPPEDSDDDVKPGKKNTKKPVEDSDDDIQVTKKTTGKKPTGTKARASK